jgi:tetratricopeptide (TPR) repeat protein/DNA-binding CsgD family transcriptional regulator
MENDATSLAYFEQYLQDVKKMGDSAEIAKAYTSIGNVLSRQGEEDAAVRNYLSSIKIFEALNRADLALIPKGNLSISLLHKNEPEKAIPYIEDVLAADKASGNQLNIAHSYTQLGQAWTQMKGYQKALSFFDEALEIIVPMKAKEPLYLLYSHRSDTYAAMGDFRSALADFRLSHAIKDSLMGEKSQQEIAALKIKFDKERELQQSKNEVETLKNQAKTKRLQYLSALFGLLLMLVMAAKFWGDRRRDKKIHTMQASLLQNQLESEKSQSQQLHQQLMLNHQDLTDLALEIARKNATLNDLLLKLERLEKANSPKMNEEIKVLKSFALSQSQLDKEKEMLHQNIDSINNEFYQKLEHRFGPLTPNEKELCGLIRLKLSNKDIAALKAISANSAKIARYRLRKRLGLEPNEDIVAFLQGI